jgi:hypothetical protein
MCKETTGMAFLSKSLPRRTVLRGLGATMALPFLDAMLPAFSLRGRAAAKPVHRFQTFYVPNGMEMRMWTPKTEGAGFALSPILEPLKQHKINRFIRRLRRSCVGRGLPAWGSNYRSDSLMDGEEVSASAQELSLLRMQP